MAQPDTDDLRRELGFLGTILGDTIREIAGDQSFQIVEQLRKAAWDRRSGSKEADELIKKTIEALDDEQMRVVIRAFTILLDLANLVEDRRRVQILQQRADAAYPGPRGESIRQAIADLKDAGKSANEVQALLDQLHVDLVFTAHPTDAKRRSVRSKLTKIRQLMQPLSSESSPQVQDRSKNEIAKEIAKLWQTDFIRPWRPSVMQEVSRGLSIKPVLWNEVPRIADELRRGALESYGDSINTKRSTVTFGSWIGGDRDGHPGVTAEITAETLSWLRREAIEFHLRACKSLHDSMSVSARQVSLGDELDNAVNAAAERWPELKSSLESLPPSETCRRWLLVIRWKLQRTRDNVADDSAYTTARRLASDVQLLVDAVSSSSASAYLVGELEAWQTQIESFGLHLARLDIRQNAAVYRQVVDEIFKTCGICESPETLDRSRPMRCALSFALVDFAVN